MSIQSVSLGTPALTAASYKSADAVSLATQRRAASTAGGLGATGGLIGALVGTAVASGMTGVEGSNFKSNHAAILAKLDEQMKLPVSTDLSTAYTSVLKRDSFFSSRFNPASPTRMEVEVIGYGLSRVEGEDEDMFTPFLNTAVTLKAPDGKVLMNRVPAFGVATAQGGSGLPLHRLAQDKKLMRTEWERAVRANAVSFQSQLQQRHGQ